MSAEADPASLWSARRHAARLAAVQALYQIEHGKAATDAVISEFIEFRFSESSEAGGGVDPDPVLFRTLVQGVGEQLAVLDSLILNALDKRWTPERMALVLRAILRAGTFELQFRQGTPARVVINEYVDLAHAFFDGPESRLVNAVLDGVARSLRSGEFAASEDRNEITAPGTACPPTA